MFLILCPVYIGIKNVSYLCCCNTLSLVMRSFLEIMKEFHNGHFSLSNSYNLLQCSITHTKHFFETFSESKH